MMYCQYCSTQLTDNAKYCLHCGKPTTGSTVCNHQELIDKLSSRLKTNGIIWAAVAIIQIILAFYGNWVLLIVGIFNIICAVLNIKNSSQILTNPNGIVKAHEPIVGTIITLAYNLFVGGVIGILGSIYYLIFVRGFVMENKSHFLAMETVAPNQSQTAAPKINIIHTSITLTEQQVSNGAQKEIYVADLQKTFKINVPKNIKVGQTLVLRNAKGTNQDGKSIQKDVYIKVERITSSSM